ncbi:MAG: hypothetical protein IPN20_04520 [Haliscomenobacter sp.]|nr:hypothetical protein [Haliscomenobacter sp.]
MTTHFNTLAAAEQAAKPGDVIWSVFRDGELHYELNISDRELWTCHGGNICHICHEADSEDE